MRFLIAGAQGFLGRYLAAAVLSHDRAAEVLGIGRSPEMPGYFSHHVTRRGERIRAPLPEGLRDTRDRRFVYWQIGLSDTDLLASAIRAYEPDVVVNLAAALVRSPEDELIAANVEGTASLMRATVSSGAPAPLVICASSGGVYGRVEPGQLPVAETAPCRPADPYSKSKLAAEEVGREIAARAGIRFTAARIFNVAGPGQSEHHLCGRLAALIAGVASCANKEIRVGDLTATRDYVDVRDVARALVLIAHSPADGIVNVASGVETSGVELLRLMLRTALVEVHARQIPDHGIPLGVPRHCGSPARLRRLGFRPSFTIERTVAEVYGYYSGL